MIFPFNNIGILGINARNLLYIRPFNSKKAVRLADSKLKTKQFLSARDIPVPKLYAVIRSQDELNKFDFSSLPPACVLKPNLGFGGEGIIPFIGRKDNYFEKASGALMSIDEVREHIGDILEGRFSISGANDTAFFEQLIVCDERLAKYAYKGLPDIRVVVHNLIPVMAMLRLPTKESDGKANLHLGAVGVGIDMGSGTATHIVHKNKIIDEIPGVGPIKGFKLPYWDEMLLIASKAQLVTNLGYMAIDLVLDKNLGPVLLEINARAGLNVQIANLAPLRRRLERIQGVKVSSPEKGVRIAKDMFGSSVERIKTDDKKIIGSKEKVTIITKDGNHVVWASINPILERTFIDKKLAQSLGATEESLKIKFQLADEKVQTLAYTDDLKGKDYEMVIGRKSLQGFLIDPSKEKPGVSKLENLEKKPPQNITVEYTPNFFEIDSDLSKLDKEIKLMQHIKPINLKEEKEKFFANTEYNPQFQYQDLSFEALHLKIKLQKIGKKLDESPLSKLYLGKIRELTTKIDLLESIGTEHFMEKSEILYGKVTERLLNEAKAKLDSKPHQFVSKGELMPTHVVVKRFEEALKEYSLNWKVVVKKEMVPTCSVDKEGNFFVREGVKFSEDRLRMIIAHEIETHILTAENGKKQNYQMFNRGFGNYLQTQEGLAIWNQEHVLDHDIEKNYTSARLIFVLNFAKDHSFAETFDYCLKLGVQPKKAFNMTSKVKRGIENTASNGVFTKELQYFSGYLQVKDFVEKGGDLKELYYGKYNLDDLDLIKKVPYLQEPFILPKFLL